MEILIVLLVAVLVFSLVWYLIGVIPFPPPLANIRWVLYAILVLIAIVWLWQRFLGGPAF